MTTFADLTNDVLLTLEGYGLNQGRAAFITTTGGITATDLSFTVDSTANLAEGVAEIEDELVYIQSVDETNNTITVSPDGRGYRGTVAAAHGVDTRVTMNPVLPRTLVKRKINETIVGVFPTLWGQATTEFPYSNVSVTYEMPTDTEDVLAVTYQAIGPSGAWPPVRRWSLDPNADSTVYPSGKVLNVWEDLAGVSTIRVWYTKQPTELAADTDDLTSTGLRASARAAIVAGASWRLVSFMDASRLRVNTVSMDQMDERNPIGSGTQVASYLRKQYERELQDEKQRQQLATPPVIYFTE